MKMKRNRGFTLLELAIVVAVIGIISALAGWQVQSLLPKFRSKAAALEFSKYVDQCRMLAIRTNKECRIAILEYDLNPTSIATPSRGKYSISLGDASYNSTIWDILPEDSFNDGSDDDQSEGFIDISPTGEQRQNKVGLLYSPGDIGGPGSGMTDSIVFNPRGFVINPSTDFSAEGYIEISFANKQALNENVNDVFVVMITRTGMTRLDNRIGRRFDYLVSGTDWNASTN